MGLHRFYSGALAAALAGFLLASCAAPREAATKLANAGTATTATIGASISQTAERVALIPEYDCLSFTLAGHDSLCDVYLEGDLPAPDPENDPVVAYKKLSTAVASRKRAVSDLGDLYSALLELAAKDEKKDWQDTADKLLGSVNTYLELFGLGAVSKPAQIIGVELAGFIGDQRQRADILKANAYLHVAVNALYEGMQKERALFQKVTDHAATAEDKTRTLLLRSGVMASAPVYKPYADALGLSMSPKAEDIIAKSPELQAGRERAVSFQAGRRRDAERSAYDASVQALKALSDQHAALANDQGVSIGAILARINEIADVITKVKAAKAE